MRECPKAVALAAGDRNGSSDPYCRLSLGRDKVAAVPQSPTTQAKTRTILSTLDPEWREVATLTWHPGEEGRLLVTLTLILSYSLVCSCTLTMTCARWRSTTGTLRRGTTSWAGGQHC